MKQAFKQINFSKDRLAVILAANRVIEEYAAAGYDMTVRQVFYQMIAGDLLPDSWLERVESKEGWILTKNTPRNYSRLGDCIDDGRMCGIIDWAHIVDRTRSLQSLAHWNDAADRIRSAWRSFRIDRWENQPIRPEIWVEKEALEGVLARVCQRNDVPFFCCRGYASQTSMKEAADRLLRHLDNGQDVIIFHLGDHDPSGMDMTRDIGDRLLIFMREAGIQIERLALNWSQIELYNPPPNFAKQTDSRFKIYQAEFGDESWELDALQPQVLDALIEVAIHSVRDDDLWTERAKEENEYDKLLRSAYLHWDDVAKFLKRKTG